MSRDDEYETRKAEYEITRLGVTELTLERTASFLEAENRRAIRMLGLPDDNTRNFPSVEHERDAGL